MCDKTSFGRDLIISTIPQMRDPFILREGSVYYAYGSGYVCMKNISGDLGGTWTPVKDFFVAPESAEGCFWAPEVHKWRGAYYMFATYRDKRTMHRGCTIYRADSPEGPFCEITGGHLTPADWDAIDATLYVDPTGQPYIVFVHEWTSTADGVGTFAYAKLSDDLTRTLSAPIEIFRADAPLWAVKGRSKVTDGCFMYTTKSGQLLMLWSNFDKDGYAVAIARSVSGKIEGPWTHDEKQFYTKSILGEYDGGHGMIFTDTDGEMYLSIHSPNAPVGARRETPIFIRLREEGDTLVWTLFDKKKGDGK